MAELADSPYAGTASNADPAGSPLHILVLTDRDWTHPQGGGTGTHLHEQVKHWLGWGHRVTIVAGGYPGSVPLERAGRLEMRRRGSRATVFPRTIAAGSRSLPDDVDVVLEVVNGITFLSPIWLRRPRVTLIHHIHREHYVREMGQAGRLAAAMLETIPLKALYRQGQFITVSGSTSDEIAALGVARDRITIAHNGVDTGVLVPGERDSSPSLLYLGRIKRYKRIELLLDAVAAIPGVRLDIAGDGDHRKAIEAAISDRGIGDRVVLHGFVDEETKLRLLQGAWVNVTASSVEGWSLTTIEAAACATPTVAIGVGGLREAVVHGSTGLLADGPGDLTDAIRLVLEDDELRSGLGRAARDRAVTFSWESTARNTLETLRRAVAAAPRGQADPAAAGK